MSELVRGAAAPAELQSRFAALSDAIAAERRRLEHWQAASRDFQQRLAAGSAPARARLRAIDMALLRLLDHAADHAGLGRSDLRLLHGVARNLTAMLLQGGEDAELRALYQRYQQDEPSEAAPDHEAAAPAGPAAEEDWMAAWERMEQASHDQADRQRRQREQHKAQARRQRRVAQAAPEHGTQTLRAVYRKLASALHPDREPDAAERARKTSLMQRVNRAYAAGSLVELLQLQLETAQIDAAAVSAMGEDALRRHTELLAEQLAELRQEAGDTAQAYLRLLGLGHGAEPTPTRVARALREQLRALQQEVAYYEWELRELEDARALKDWLREHG